jgi:aminomethyltransferase
MKTTPLHATHVALSAKMGEFAGYDMPLYYAEGVLKEHEWVRSHAGLFDVSHMGQILLSGKGVAQFLERITPSSFQASKPFVAKYTVLTNEQGGIVDDLIVTRLSDDVFFTVINAGCKEKDIEWITSHLPEGVTLHRLDDRALIAIQGPKAEAALRDTCGVDLSSLNYMRMTEAKLEGAEVFISRLGYTGEDGFEISIPASKAESLWNRLLQNPDVKSIGLAARDSLRLEMGYCLYGHDINAETTPLEADLSWVMGKDNVSYIGADKMKSPARKRVGIVLTGRGVAREGAEIRNKDDRKIGVLTSGSFAPTLKQSIGQGYVETDYAVPGTEIFVNVRGNNIEARVESMPFMKPNTKSIKKAV